MGTNANEGSADAGRVFKTVNGKSLDGGAQKGNITFIRPKELADAGTLGVVAEGVYVGTVPNNFDATKLDFKVQRDDGSLIILNSAGSLASQLGKIATGSYVRITYAGMTPMTKGKMAGKLAHSFIVEVSE